MHSEDFLRTLQTFGAGNVQGGIALCGSAGCNPQPNATNNNENDDGGREATEIIRDVFIILLVGIAAVGGLVLLTYLSALISDRYCCCFPWFRPVSDLHEYNARFDRGVVARKARLWGLTLDERAQVLTAFFEKRIFSFERKATVQKQGDNQMVTVTEDVPLDEGSQDFPAETTAAVDLGSQEQKPNKDGVVSDIEAGDSPRTGNEKLGDRPSETEAATNKDENEATGNWLGDAWKTLSASISQADNQQDETQRTEAAAEPKEGKEGEVEEEETKEKKEGEEEEEEERALDDADHERICCICLNEYEHEDKLITGTQCVHQFHYTCCMEWLGKNDHCPYCRQEMLTATQMRQAAIETLGRERVQELGAPVPESAPTVAAVPTANRGEPQQDPPVSTTVRTLSNGAETPTSNAREGDIEMGRTAPQATTTGNAILQA